MKSICVSGSIKVNHLAAVRILFYKAIVRFAESLLNEGICKLNGKRWLKSIQFKKI